MNKNVLIGIIVVVVVLIGGYYYMQSNSANQVATADSSFESDAAAILALPNVSAQAKIDQLNANLQYRIAAKQALAAHGNIPVKPAAVTTTTVKH